MFLIISENQEMTKSFPVASDSRHLMYFLSLTLYLKKKNHLNFFLSECHVFPVKNKPFLSNDLNLPYLSIFGSLKG